MRIIKRKGKLAEFNSYIYIGRNIRQISQQYFSTSNTNPALVT